MPKADLLQKKILIADWPKYLRNSFTQRVGSPNGRALALHARCTEINAPTSPQPENLRNFYSLSEEELLHIETSFQIKTFREKTS